MQEMETSSAMKLILENQAELMKVFNHFKGNAAASTVIMTRVARGLVTMYSCSFSQILKPHHIFSAVLVDCVLMQEVSCAGFDPPNLQILVESLLEVLIQIPDDAEADLLLV
ncbi:hypothetical protein HAX54_002869 [Datura stramonium]|uniref:Uncharacterized protein n=1 Tax=Datura stramonium TaxID=4076 RepID=A0ABS8T6Q4_DATST|nr:hypothetical protein [Datura stramonium]